MPNPESKHRLGTLALHAGQEPDPVTGARAVPIYSTTSYVFHDTDHAANLFALREFGFIYSRIMNPTCDVLEKRMAALEGGAAALAFASGQSAVTAAILTITHAGQNLISATSLYGGTHTLFTQTLKHLGVEVRFFDPDHPEEIHKLVDENTRLVFLESIGNPKNDVPDFEAISALAHSHGLPVLMDNTVLTPALFKPFDHGVDVSIYSTTKFLGGHGVHVGGVVVDSGKFLWADNPKKWPEFTEPDPSYHGVVFTEALAPMGNISYIIYMRTHWLRDTGAAMSPYAAFLFLLGIETLHLRMERHTANAQAFSEWLAAHPAVEWVNYPGLPGHPHHANAKRYIPGGPGAVVGFGIKGGKAAGVKLINNLKLASHLANLGDAKTLVIHPASTTHQQLTEEEQLAAGVRPEYIRVSVGIEDIADIKEDFEQALQISQK
jgi:O-acetylhomoserine (thiol)-lyase